MGAKVISKTTTLARAIVRHYLSPIIFGVTTVWFVVFVLIPSAGQLTHGFAAYYVAAKLLVNGEISEAVYDPAYFRPVVEASSHQQASDIYNANPPTTSLLFVPLTLFPIQTARVIWTIVNALLLWGGVLLLVWVFAPTHSPGTTLVLLSIAMLFQPAIENIRLGQAYLLIFFLSAITATAWHKHHNPTYSALALASALLLKTAGWMLLPLLAWQRRRQWLAWTSLFCVSILLLTLLIFPPTMWWRYLVLLREVTTSPQVCATAYQTTRSLLCQLFVLNPPWSAQPLFHAPMLAEFIYWGLALVTLILSFRLSRRAPVAAMLSVITWGILFAPVGEQYHHTVILIPLVWLVLAWQQGQHHRKTSKLFLVSAVLLYLLPWSINPPVSQSGIWIVTVYPRLIAAWLIWFVAVQE